MSNLVRTARRWCCVVLCCLGVVAGLANTVRSEELKTKTSAPCGVSQRGKRIGDQFWVISTRHLGCTPMTQALPDYHVKYFAQNKWYAATAETFLQNDATGLPTIIFIHGNRYTSADAVNSGWEAYYALTKGMPAHRQIRFVVWSWPSAQDSGLIRDVREKSARTLVEGYYLSRLLHRMQPTVQTGIVGYSFGSRIALGAVHLTAGGQLEGRTVPEPQPEVAAMYRVAMLAPGVEDYGLVPGARFDLAIHRIDRLLNLYNPADPALKRYRFVSKSERPTAMGYSGIVGESRLGDASARITECNVSGIIGKTHNEDPYFASERVMSQVRNTVLGGMHVDKAAELSQN